MNRIVSMLSLAVVCISCGSNENNNEPKVKSAASDSVAAFVLKAAPATRSIALAGELLPFEQAQVYAKVSGYIRAVKVDIGDRVAAGQLLAIAEAPEMQAQYEQATAEVLVARSKLQGSRDALDRLRKAGQREGTVAEGEIERLRSNWMADSAALQSAVARQSALGNLKDYLNIKAPFAGIITQRNIDAGALVGTASGGPLFTIQQSGQLRLRLPIPEAYATAVPNGTLLQFTVDAWPGETFAGTLTRKAGAINLQNRTETWEFLVNNADGKLKPGMYISASLQLSRPGKSMLVPLTAIATTLEKKFVIRMENGMANHVMVRQGLKTAEGLEIFGDLNEGDTLLVRATDEIVPGKSLTLKFPAKGK